MKHAVAFSLLLASMTLAGQAPQTFQAGNVDPQNGRLTSVPCPVSMHALQGRGSGMIAVRSAKPADGPSQGIHLVLSTAREALIASARVRVRGLSARGRVARASSNENSAADMTRTLEVTFTPEGDKDAAADLVLPGFTSVSSIELQSIAYRDGSDWSLGGRKMCRVAPDPIMLIAGR